jgi:hypothetical protein
MTDSTIETTLANKIKEIQAYIASLERDLERARRDLSAVMATRVVFSANPPDPKAYMNIARLFSRNELPKLAREALQSKPDGMTTPEIARHVTSAKGLDAKDKRLTATVAHRVIAVLRRLEKERKIKRIGKRGAVTWASIMDRANPCPAA